MDLTENQKKYIKKKIKSREVDRIANDLGLSIKKINDYLLTTNYRIKENQLAIERKFILKSEIDEMSHKVLPSIKSIIKDNWITILILIGLAIITYANSLGNQFVSDDRPILETKNIYEWGRAFKQPSHLLGELIKTIAFKINGFNPFFYRLFNYLFHFATIVGVFVLVSLLSQARLAFIVAALFAVHPLNSEAVVWISAIQYTQLACFSIWGLINYRIWQINRQWINIFAVIVLFILSLLSSEKSIVFPLIILIFELAYGNIKIFKKTLVVVTLFSVVAGFFYQNLIKTIINVFLNYDKQSFITNLLTQIPIALTLYWQLLFWPDKLTLYHSEFYFTIINYIIRVIITGAIIGFIIYGYKKNRIIFFSLALFIISLIPFLTPFGFSWIVAERYVYLGSVGMFSVIGYGLWKIIKNKKTEGLGYLIFIIIILLLMVRTIFRNMDWKNEDTLWFATGKTSPSDPKTHNNLGDVYGRQGNLEKSAEEFKIAIKLNPKYADAYHNLGNTYKQMGRVQEAVGSYQSAIKYNPKLWQSYQNLAVIYFSQKKFVQAEQMILQAIKIDPENIGLKMNLGVVYLNLEKKELAKEQFEKVLQLDPTNKEAVEGLRLIKN